MSDSRIPRSIPLFSTYIGNTLAHLLAGTPANWIRFVWLQTELDQWTAFNTAWLPLIAKYNDKKNSRTSAVTDGLHQIITDCIKLDQENHLLNRIASLAPSSNTTKDLATFNIKPGSAATHSHTAIEAAVVAGMQSIGGGDVKIKCRTLTAKRAGIAAGADSVQYLYQIGGTAPANAETAGLTKDHSSKAAFTLHTGAASSGKTLYIFFRWYNTKHPELAGPWTGVLTVPIS